MDYEELVPQAIRSKLENKYRLNDEEDLTTPETSAIKEREQLKAKIPVEISIEDKQDAEKLEMVHQIEDMLRECGIAYQDFVRDKMNEAAINHRSVFDEEMKARMEKKGYDLPRFNIMDGGRADEFLDKNELPNDLTPDSVLVVFNRSPVLGRFWYKGIKNQRDNPIDETQNVAWGRFAADAVDMLWEFPKMADEQDIEVTRINEQGQHKEPNGYYYVWQVSRKELNPDDDPYNGD